MLFKWHSCSPNCQNGVCFPLVICQQSKFHSIRIKWMWNCVTIQGILTLLNEGLRFPLTGLLTDSGYDPILLNYSLQSSEEIYDANFLSEMNWRLVSILNRSLSDVKPLIGKYLKLLLFNCKCCWRSACRPYAERRPSGGGFWWWNECNLLVWPIYGKTFLVWYCFKVHNRSSVLVGQ